MGPGCSEEKHFQRSMESGAEDLDQLEKACLERVGPGFHPNIAGGGRGNKSSGVQARGAECH